MGGSVDALPRGRSGFRERRGYGSIDAVMTYGSGQRAPPNVAAAITYRSKRSPISYASLVDEVLAISASGSGLPPADPVMVADHAACLGRCLRLRILPEPRVGVSLQSAGCTDPASAEPLSHIRASPEGAAESAAENAALANR